MIASLSGRLASKAPAHITLDVQGVGYEVFIPLSTYYTLPNPGESITLHIHTHLRDDCIQLFGFSTSEEKGIFLLLTGVSGVGPKLALNVLSALSAPDFCSAVRTGDLDKLTSVPGIGRKSAGRIALELKDKIDRIDHSQSSVSEDLSGASSQVLEDALSALVNLGYRASDVRIVLKRMARSTPTALPLKDVIRETLKELARG